MALLAAFVAASPALAHGAHPGAAAAAMTGAPAIDAGAAAAEASIAIAGDGAAAPHCPLLDGRCCADHCCIGMALAVTAPELTVDFATAPDAAPAPRTPPDLPQSAPLRPPSR